MAKVLVTINSNPELFSEIDLSNSEWSSLLIDNLSPFKMEESKRVCSAYPQGIFPGAESFGSDKQVSRISKFGNYIEFSKIVSDEVVPIAGQLYLTTKFYDRRKDGWSSDKVQNKQGEVIGYCLNGDIYCAADKDLVENDVFYGIVYRSLVSKDASFLKLQQQLRDGICLVLVGEDTNFINKLSNILLKSMSSK